jgi:hypothetical protein
MQEMAFRVLTLRGAMKHVMFMRGTDNNPDSYKEEGHPLKTPILERSGSLEGMRGFTILTGHEAPKGMSCCCMRVS